MTSLEKRLIEFAIKTLDRMQAEPEWGSSTLDDIAGEAFRLRLARLRDGEDTDGDEFVETKPVKAYKI